MTFMTCFPRPYLILNIILHYLIVCQLLGGFVSLVKLPLWRGMPSYWWTLTHDERSHPSWRLRQNNLSLIPWKQRFRHPTRNECMGWFVQIQVGGLPNTYNIINCVWHLSILVRVFLSHYMLRAG